MVDKIFRNGEIVDGDKIMAMACDAIWSPVFSPAGDKMLVRSIEDGTYYRRILPVADILK